MNVTYEFAGCELTMDSYKKIYKEIIGWIADIELKKEFSGKDYHSPTHTEELRQAAINLWLKQELEDITITNRFDYAPIIDLDDGHALKLLAESLILNEQTQVLLTAMAVRIKRNSTIYAEQQVDRDIRDRIEEGREVFEGYEQNDLAYQYDAESQHEGY